MIAWNNSIDEALEIASKPSLEVVLGIELLLDLQQSEMHILGYYIDYEFMNQRN
jgi:hypothetical protein